MEAQPGYCINMVSFAFLPQCKQLKPNAKCYSQQQGQTTKLSQAKTHLKITGLAYLSSSQQRSQCKMRIHCALMQAGQRTDYM